MVFFIVNDIIYDLLSVLTNSDQTKIKKKARVQAATKQFQHFNL
jgi:hypothetical protein